MYRKAQFHCSPTTWQQSLCSTPAWGAELTPFCYFEPFSFIRSPAGPLWKGTNPLLNFSTAFLTSQTSRTLLFLLSPIFLFQADKYSLFSCAARSPFGIQTMPFIHLWIASIATATLRAMGRMIVVQRYSQRVDLCGHIVFPSVFYSFSHNSQPLSRFFDSCQAPIYMALDMFIELLFLTWRSYSWIITVSSEPTFHMKIKFLCTSLHIYPYWISSAFLLPSHSTLQGPSVALHKLSSSSLE